MNGESQHNEEQNSVSKKLKELPRVKASPDFEARLHRRIASSKVKAEPKSLFGFLFFPRRVPVFATSVIALFAVSVISYYLFIRSADDFSRKDSQPQTIAESTEPQQSSQTEVGKTEQVSSQSQDKLEVLVQKDEDSKGKKETVPPSIELKKKQNDIDFGKMNQPAEQNIEMEEQAVISGQDNVAKGIPVQVEPEAKQVQQKVEMKASEPAQEIQQKMVQPLQQFQSVPTASERTRISEFNAMPQKMKAGRIPDSVRIADSLRQDSIKKALQKQFLQQKQKIKPQ